MIILPDKPSDLSCSDRGDDLGLYPLGKVIYHDKRYLHRPVALGKGLNIPQVANGKGLTMGVRGVEGSGCAEENFWHLS